MHPDLIQRGGGATCTPILSSKGKHTPISYVGGQHAPPDLIQGATRTWILSRKGNTHPDIFQQGAQRGGGWGQHTPRSYLARFFFQQEYYQWGVASKGQHAQVLSSKGNTHCSIQCGTCTELSWRGASHSLFHLGKHASLHIDDTPLYIQCTAQQKPWYLAMAHPALFIMCRMSPWDGGRVLLPPVALPSHGVATHSVFKPA